MVVHLYWVFINLDISSLCDSRGFLARGMGGTKLGHVPSRISGKGVKNEVFKSTIIVSRKFATI